MRVWLVEIGEPLPISGCRERLLRYGIIGNLLAAQGHEVVWWSSTFDHTKKVHVTDADATVQVADCYELRLLHANAYSSNVSLTRILNHCRLAGKFLQFADDCAAPDIILCGLPIIELSCAAVTFGRKHDIPVVLDIQDLWPEVFLDLTPIAFRSCFKALLWPYYLGLRYALKGAFSIIGITPAYVEWGLKQINKLPSSFEKDFPLAYSDCKPSDSEITESYDFWRSCGLVSGDGKFVVCFFGTIGRQFDLETIIGAAKILNRQAVPIKFVLCGHGDRLSEYQELASGLDNVLFPGWVNMAQIWALMRISRVGIAPYLATNNFLKNIPNKPVEYLSASLPVLSSIHGVLGELLKNHDCGIIYKNGDSKGLAAMLISLFENPSHVEIMSHNAKLLYEARFRVEKVYSELISHLESVSKNYHGR